MKHQHREAMGAETAGAGSAAIAIQNRPMRTLKWLLPFLAVFLPIVLISVYAYSISSESVRTLIQTEHDSATGNIAQLLMEDMKDGINLVSAVASVQGTVEAVRKRDIFAINARLKAVTVSYPQVDRAYVTFPDGVIWAEHPVFGMLRQGADLSPMEWYRTTSKDWKPSISGVYRRATEDRAPAIAFAAPVKDEQGTVLAILVFEYPTLQITQWLQNISLSHDGYLVVVDHNGSLVAHPTMDPEDSLYRGYADVPAVQKALSGSFYTTEYTDPLSGEEVIATFLPFRVGKNLWTIVAQQPVATSFAQLNHVKASIALVGGVMTLFTLVMVVAVARIDARKVRLNQMLHRTNVQLREIASIVHFSHDAIVGLRLDGTITSWNDSAERMYGYTAKEMIGRSIAFIVPEDKRTELNTLLQNLQQRTGVQTLETERVRKDGARVPVSVTISPVNDGDETVVAASSIERDVTERREIERMKSDFISFVSHQLKAPVTAMRWLLEEILDGDFGQISPELTEVVRDLQSINADNHHLISDILNISRIERGVITVDLSPVPLHEVAEHALRDYRMAIAKAGLYLRIEEPPEQIIALADKEKMAEAVGNAVSNAIKHTTRGGITIRMFAREGYGVMEVEDTGEGIPAELIGKLFTRDQILGGNARPDSSAGLGLYITKKFMELQNGEVSARSTLGKGSTFVYRIPLAKEGEDPDIEEKRV